MNSQELENILPTIVDLAYNAGKAIMSYYNGGYETTQKNDASPLTAADLAAHHIITGELTTQFSQHGVLSEESAQHNDLTHKEYCWIVDPLDGTKEFISKNGEFTVNIALVQNHQPILGVVHLPAKGTTYYAAKNRGAFMLEHQGFNKETPIRVSQRQQDLILAVSRSHAGLEEERLKKHPLVGRCISAGSSLKGCLVAEGTADLYYRFGPTMEWDTAAMHIIAEEAGGTFRQMDGSPMTYNRKNHRNEKGFYMINQMKNQLLREETS